MEESTRKFAPNDGDLSLYFSLLQQGERASEEGLHEAALEFYHLALSACDEAVIQDPENPRWWRNKGITLQHLGSFEEAYEAYTIAITCGESYEDISFVYHERASILYKLKRYQEALLDLDEAIGDKPPIRSWLQDRANVKNAIADEMKKHLYEILRSAAEDYKIAESLDA